MINARKHAHHMMSDLHISTWEVHCPVWQAPIGAPIPSHEVDLTARYGAEHPHQTVVEGEKTLLRVTTRATLSAVAVVSAAMPATRARYGLSLCSLKTVGAAEMI